MTLALVGWFLAIAVILVASAVVAAEFDRAQESWAHRLRGRLGIESSVAEGRPLEVLPAPPVRRPVDLGRPQPTSSPAPVDPGGAGSSAQPGRPASDTAP